MKTKTKTRKSKPTNPEAGYTDTIILSSTIDTQTRDNPLVARQAKSSARLIRRRSLSPSTRRAKRKQYFANRKSRVQHNAMSNHPQAYDSATMYRPNHKRKLKLTPYNGALLATLA